MRLTIRCTYYAITKNGPAYTRRFRNTNASIVQFFTSEFANRTDVDLDDGVWQARAGDTKSGEEKLVPLSRQAVSLLRGLSGEGDYVFGGETPFVTHKVKHNKLYKAAGRVKDDSSHPDGGWTPHDFRRTQRTRLARVSGVKSHVADMLAGRRGNEQQGVSGIYNQHDYLEEMRHAAQAWADWLEVVVNDEETVVPMEAAQ